MVERRPRSVLWLVATVASLLPSCNATAPTPVFERAEVVATQSGVAPCADACKPRSGERVEACHLGSLESALLARREMLGDRGVRRDAMVCLYRRTR